MRRIFLHLAAGIFVFLPTLALPSFLSAQSDAAMLYKANCVLCHAANGSGDADAGKALKAKDLRSPEVQKNSDDQLAEFITQGKDKMPAFGKKLKPDDIKHLVAYVRELSKKK